VTLTGVGGSGKSRLALRVAEVVERSFGDGVAVVELAPVSDGLLLPYQVAEVLGVREQPGRAVSEVVVDYLHDRELLLVLDNCEHLLDACGEFVGAVLRGAVGVRVLCTSRHPVRVPGEFLFEVAPLAVPGVEIPVGRRALSRFSAVGLFVERARAVAPGFALTTENRAVVVDICRRLDGLPLAIELAAARVGGVPGERIKADLDGRLEADGRVVDGAPLARHRSLQATFDWSFELCSPAERELWARLSVFAGSFDVDAVEYVCGGEGAADSSWQTVTGLVDKSVVVAERRAGRPWYRLLETVRQYGHDRLRAGEDGLRVEAVLRRRHGEWYAGLAGRARAEWFGPAQVSWLDRLRVEHANVRAALEYHLGGGQGGRAGLGMAADLLFFWLAGGLLAEGWFWLDRAIGLDTEPSPQRAHALWTAAWIAIAQGDLPAGSDLAEQGQQLARHIGDPTAAAHAEAMLSSVVRLQGDPDSAIRLAEDALAMHEAGGLLDSTVIMARVSLATACTFQGDLERAIALCHQCRQVCAAHGELWACSYALYTLALTELAAGRPRPAADHARECLRIKHALHDMLGIAMTLEVLAWITGAATDHARAARLLGAADKAWRSVGRPQLGADNYQAPHQQCQDQACTALGPKKYKDEYNAGARLSADRAVAYAFEGPTFTTSSTPP
jgi:predicted ATPase